MPVTVKEIDDLIEQLRTIRERVKREEARARIDPDLLKAREIVASKTEVRSSSYGYGSGYYKAKEYREGKYDHAVAVQSTLAGIKAGRFDAAPLEEVLR
jgi:hypothetical protein